MGQQLSLMARKSKRDPTVKVMEIDFIIPKTQIKWVHHHFAAEDNPSESYYAYLLRGPMAVEWKTESFAEPELSIHLDMLYRTVYEEGYRWLVLHTPDLQVRLPFRKDHLECKNMRELITWLPPDEKFIHCEV
jgi:hypothetical protein